MGNFELKVKKGSLFSKLKGLGNKTKKVSKDTKSLFQTTSNKYAIARQKYYERKLENMEKRGEKYIDDDDRKELEKSSKKFKQEKAYWER